MFIPILAVLACIGTSVTAGTHNTAGHDLCTVIANALGMTPLNKGVPGNTSTQMQARFATDIVANAPAAVLIEQAFVNDLPAEISADQNKANLNAMIQAAQTAGIQPVLLSQNLVASSTWINAAPPYMADIRELAGQYGLRIIDWQRIDFDAWFYDPTSYDSLYVTSTPGTGDYQHPNDAGVALLGPEALHVMLGR